MLCRDDVSSDDDCRRMVAAAAERWGRLDVLVNSAGTTKFVPHSNLDGLDAEDFQRIYAVNTIGPFQMARAAAPHMRSAGAGAIVNVSSGAGIYGRGSSIAYGASKGALNNLTLALARVLAPEIRVNAVCPTLVDTRWMRTLMGEDYEKRIAATRAKVPLHKVCSPEDVAETILWLVAGAGTMTGELILMDGGQHLL
jgi:3-oxoacyl-[acyl-carrier protein] reductase